MGVVNIHEAKTHLSRLLERVSAGEDIVIARNGRPVARLVAVDRQQRRPGRLKGRLRLGADFDAPLPDAVVRRFRGER